MDISTDQMALQQAGVSKADTRTAKNQAELKEALQGFEAIMLQAMMKSMRATIPEGGLFEKNNAADTYEFLHDQFLSDELSKGKQALGLKELLYEQLKDHVR